MSQAKSGSSWMVVALLVVLGFAVVSCLVLGLLVAIAVPGFLRAREVSHLNSCQENQVKLDAALQQYYLEKGFDSLEEMATVANLGTLKQTTPGDSSWSGILIGPDLYLRQAPECKSGGLYVITPQGPHLVACTLSERDGVDARFWHRYPGPPTWGTNPPPGPGGFSPGSLPTNP